MAAVPPRRSPLGVLLRFDLRLALSSPRGVLFLVFFGVVWSWILSKLAGGGAEKLASEDVGVVLSLVLDGSLLRLIHERPTTLAAYFVIAVTLTPWFAILGSCDQTAGDLGTKHLRFLIPRVGRSEIFVARFLGSVILVGGLHLLSAVAATIIQLVVGGHDTTDVLRFGLQVGTTLTLYSIAFVALMSLISALVASIGLSLLAGLGGYLVVVAAATFLSISWSNAAYLAAITPAGLKAALLRPSGVAFALVGLVAYAAAYLGAGFAVFRSRDA